VIYLWAYSTKGVSSLYQDGENIVFAQQFFRQKDIFQDMKYIFLRVIEIIEYVDYVLTDLYIK